MSEPAAPGLAARGGTLGLRLALAFLAVALAAVALLAGLTAAFAAADVSTLASQQRAELASAIAVAAGAAWDRNNTWSIRRPLPGPRPGRPHRRRPSRSATRPGTSSPPRPASPPRTARSRACRSWSAASAWAPPWCGPPVPGSTPPTACLQTALLRAIAGAAGLAALLALLTGLAVARRITRPVTRLIAVTRAMAAGDRAARVGEIHAPGELRELAAAFDQMAGTLDRQEQIRRNLVADVAHELRTPIAILQAGHEALLDGVAEPTPAELGSLRDEVLAAGAHGRGPADAGRRRRRRPEPGPAPLPTWPSSPPPRPTAWPAGSRRRASRWTGSWPRARFSPTRTGCTR